jgi:hypothetical protein
MTETTPLSDLLHTTPVCPFCGFRPDEIGGFEAINATICEPCTENLHLLSARYATLFTEDGVFEAYVYLPITDEWRELTPQNNPTPIVFLAPNPERVTDLSTETQKSIQAYATGAYQDVLRSAPQSEIAPKYLDIILRDRSPSNDLRKSEISQLRADIEAPTVVTTTRLYSKTLASLRREEQAEPTQATFSQVA